MNSSVSWSLSVALTVFTLGGCSTAASRVTIEPWPGRPEAQARAADARCADAASAMTTNRQSVRDREYAACLLAQGYRITMPFRAGVDHARLTISSPEGRPATTVATDLAACQDAAWAGRVGNPAVVAGRFGGLYTADSLQVRPHTSDSPELVNQLVSCLGQRGYDAKS